MGLLHWGLIFAWHEVAFDLSSFYALGIYCIFSIGGSEHFTGGRSNFAYFSLLVLSSLPLSFSLLFTFPLLFLSSLAFFRSNSGFLLAWFYR
jgi:hypothetical protein